MRILLFCCCIALSGCIVSDHPSNATVLRKILPTYAKGFQIEEMSDGSRQITLFNLEKPGEILQVIHWNRTDVHSVACLSTTHIAFLDKLGKMDLLKGVGFSELVKNVAAKKRIDDGSVINLTVGHDTDDEKLYSIRPELFFVYPFGGAGYGKYLDNGIGCVQISEYLENHPLGRAEWIKVFGVLLNAEAHADSIFRDIENAYNTLVSQVNVPSTVRPKVFTGSYDGGNWFAPPGNSFAAKLINDAGGQYIFSDSIAMGNLIIPFESMIQAVYDTDYWGKIFYDVGEVTRDKMTGGDERLKNLKAYRDGNLFYCNTAECDYHGDAIMEPHIMLADLVAIFLKKTEKYDAVYFKRLQ